MTDYIEVGLSWLFSNAKGHDAKGFIKMPAFASHPKATLSLTSPDCGAQGSTLGPEYMHGGEGKFPELDWTAAAAQAQGVKEWLLVSEDPDAPLPTPICHGIYMGIPTTKTSVVNADFAPAGDDDNLLAGGFRYGENRRGNVYIPPRPLLNHGVHRYLYFIVALSEPLPEALTKSKKASRKDIGDAIEGKVLGWGSWMGQCERRWK